MIDNRLQKLASLMVNYSTQVKKGEYVLIQGNSVSEPLLKEIYREVIRAGAYPEISVSIDGVKEILLKDGSDEQLQFILPSKRTIAEKCDVLIHLWGETNTKSLSNVDSKRISMQRRANREIVEIQHEREEKGEFRWCGTQFPTHADAQEAGMSLEEYENFVYEAGHLDKEDPVAEWNRISERQQKIVEYLNTKKELHIISKILI
jgi:aminopeptidase